MANKKEKPGTTPEPVTEPTAPETTPPEAPGADSTGVDTLADTMEAGFPEPSGAGLDATQEPEKLDSQGFTFDPATHVTNPDGTPALTVDGYLKRKRGRKPGTATTPKISSSFGGSNAETTAAPGVSVNPAFNAMAEMGVFALVGFRCWIGGDEARPGEEERGALKSALAAWAEYENVEMTPRTLGLLAVAGFTVPAFFTPKGQEKIGKLINHFSGASEPEAEKAE